GSVPGIRAISNPSAESADSFGCLESRLQRRLMTRPKSPGALPQAANEKAPFALNTSSQPAFAVLRHGRHGCLYSSLQQNFCVPLRHGLGKPRCERFFGGTNPRRRKIFL